MSSTLTAKIGSFDLSHSSAGEFTSSLMSAAYGGLNGYPDIFSLSDVGREVPTTIEYLDQGSIIRREHSSNGVYLEASELVFDLIDGEELPVGFTDLRHGYVRYEWSRFLGVYSSAGGWSYPVSENSEIYTLVAPITQFSISRSDAPRELPLPSSLLLTALGLILMHRSSGTHRRR